jgi:hypothetical protein
MTDDREGTPSTPSWPFGVQNGSFVCQWLVWTCYMTKVQVMAGCGIVACSAWSPRATGPEPSRPASRRSVRR